MIKPGKVTCVGLVAILMVLPNDLLKRTAAGANGRDATRVRPGAHASRPVGKRSQLGR
jgi:hypothetical protein